MRGMKRRGLSLLEMMLVCGFLSLMLLVLALTLQQFYRGRSQLEIDDRESQILRLMTLQLSKEMEGCLEVLQTNPDLILRCRDLSDSTRLPDTFPNPAPTREPAWNPSSQMALVRYYHDSSTSTWMRETTFANGSVSSQRLQDGIYGFTVSNTTDQDFSVTVSFSGRRGILSLQQTIHRADD